VRDYKEAAHLGVIDAEVRRLVHAMNIAQMRTFASCEGHGWLRMNQPPYVCFVADFAVAARLANALHRADMTGLPVLQGAWSVRLFGESPDGHKQQFMLAMTWHGRDFWPAIRRVVRRDLELLAQLVCTDPGSAAPKAGALDDLCRD